MQLHGDQGGNGLFVGGRGQNKVRTAERRGIECTFSLVRIFFFNFSFINVFLIDLFFIFDILIHLWLEIEDVEMKFLKSSMVQIKVAYI